MHAFNVLCAKSLPYHLNGIHWSGKGFLSLSWPTTDDSAETGSPVSYSMQSAVAPSHNLKPIKIGFKLFELLLIFCHLKPVRPFYTDL